MQMRGDPLPRKKYLSRAEL